MWKLRRIALCWILQVPGKFLPAIHRERTLTNHRDSFVGGYVAQYIMQKQSNQWDIKAAVQYGCKAAARVIEHLGCLAPIPWADEVDIPRYPKNEDETQQTT